MCCSPNRVAVRAATHYHTRAWQTLIYGKECFILLLFVITHTDIHARVCAPTKLMTTGTENYKRFASPVAALTIHFSETLFTINAQRKRASVYKSVYEYIKFLILLEPRTPESIVKHILVFGMCPIKYDDCSTRICMGLNKYLRILKSILTRT